MACTAKQLLAIAAAEIGQTESPFGSNRTKYGAWYPMNAVPWCDEYVSWCFYMAQATDIGGKFAYTPSHAAFFKSRGEWVTGTINIRLGDICFFDFPNDGVNRISHIGIVEFVRADGDIVTIEGNTSDGDNRDGGRVMRRVRNPKYIVGYGRPAYLPEPTDSTPTKPTPTVQPYVLKRTLERGMNGEDVKKLQLALNAKRMAAGVVDGDFGPSTEGAVKRFQNSKKLAADGEVGHDTAVALGWQFATVSSKPAHTVAKFTLSRVLKQGDKGTDVKKLQDTMNGLGFTLGTADGVFGNRTHDAVRRFQKSKNLKADGIVGERSARALGWNWEG